MLDAGGSPVLNRDEAALLSQAICRGWAYEACADDWPAFAEGVRRMQLLPGGRVAARALARGLLTMAKSYPGTWAERTRKLIRASELALRSLA